MQAIINYKFELELQVKYKDNRSMSFIAVSFGYNQQRLFNTNCEIAPLMDAIHKECYKDMDAKLVEREEFFNKEIAQFKKEQASLEKKLEKLEAPPPPDLKNMPGMKAALIDKNAKKDDKKGAKDKKGKPAKKSKKELQAEEEERKRKEAEEEERKRKEEEEEKKR